MSAMINKRLSKLSSKKKIYISIKKYYNEALISSGHDKLKGYDENGLNSSNKKTNRSKKIIYFNPPFCNSVKTYNGKIFLKLVRLHFPNNIKFHKTKKKYNKTCFIFT